VSIVERYQDLVYRSQLCGCGSNRDVRLVKALDEVIKTDPVYLNVEEVQGEGKQVGLRVDLATGQGKSKELALSVWSVPGWQRKRLWAWLGLVLDRLPDILVLAQVVPQLQFDPQASQGVVINTVAKFGGEAEKRRVHGIVVVDFHMVSWRAKDVRDLSRCFLLAFLTELDLVTGRALAFSCHLLDSCIVDYGL
jgi:hypothetical protein